MIEHKLFTDRNARAYTFTDEDDGIGTYGYLAHVSAGDWSWKPYRYAGPRCTCTLARPVGTDCARHI